MCVCLWVGQEDLWSINMCLCVLYKVSRQTFIATENNTIQASIWNIWQITDMLKDKFSALDDYYKYYSH